MEPHPHYWSPCEEVAAALEAGRSPADVITELRRERCGASHIARALCVVLDLDVQEAHRRVLDALPAEEARQFRAALDGERAAESDDRDREDIAETFEVEAWARRVRGIDGAAWLAEEVVAASRRVPTDIATLIGLSVAADRATCPAPLVPTLLRAARALDASQCRAPLATIVRHHGPGPVLREIDAMVASGAPRAMACGAMWRYWLPPTSDAADVLHRLAHRLRVSADTDLSDEHARWSLFVALVDVALDRELDALARVAALDPQLRRAMAVEMVDRLGARREAGLLDRLVGLLEVVVAEDPFVQQRINEWRLWSRLGDDQSRGDLEDLVSGSDWLQRKVADTSLDRAVLEVLAARGRSRRIRSAAAQRLAGMSP